MLSYARGISLGLAIFTLTVAVSAKDHPHVADADREYAAVFSHADNPCQESTTVGWEQCLGKEVEFAEIHLNAFLEAVRGILADEDGGATGTGSAGQPKELDLLNNGDRAWREYKKHLCQLAFAGFEGGSGGPSAELECQYRVDREYVKQVADAIELKILAK
jgi:uncharacterized protein YecT (DUF1311 family)